MIKNVAASNNSAIKHYIFAVLTSLVTGIYIGFMGLMKYVENLSQPGLLLKVRQSRNDFFKPTVLPKKRTKKFILFLEEIEGTKKTFRN